MRDRARQLGSTRWLVNNAGVDKLGPLIKRTPEELAIVRLNCESVVTMCAAIVPDLVEAHAGGWSMSDSLPRVSSRFPHDATYAASKAFVLSFTEALSIELGGSGVTATAVCPGPVSTEIFDKLAPGVPRKRPAGEISAEECARFAIAAAESGRGRDRHPGRAQSPRGPVLEAVAARARAAARWPHRSAARRLRRKNRTNGVKTKVDDVERARGPRGM